MTVPLKYMAASAPLKFEYSIGTITSDQSLSLCAVISFPIIYEHLLIVAAVSNFNIFILIGWDPSNTYL